MFNEKLYEEANEKISWISNFLIEYGDKFDELPLKQQDIFKKEFDEALRATFKMIRRALTKDIKNRQPLTFLEICLVTDFIDFERSFPSIVELIYAYEFFLYVVIPSLICVDGSNPYSIYIEDNKLIFSDEWEIEDEEGNTVTRNYLNIETLTIEDIRDACFGACWDIFFDGKRAV